MASSKESKLSSHVQTIVVSLATGAIGWMAYSVQENNVQVAVLSEKVDQLEARISYAKLEPAREVPSPTHGKLFSFDALPANYGSESRYRK